MDNNREYIDEKSVKDSLRTIDQIQKNYMKYTFWNTTKYDSLQNICTIVHLPQMTIYNSIQELKTITGFDEKLMDKFIENLRKNKNIMKYSLANNMMCCDDNITMKYIKHIQNKHANSEYFADFYPDFLYEFYSKYDKDNLL
ncbi:MAG: hypothetical protein IJ848_03540 [Alphaproteobacteria bacterium]|nr:hypothetical protein [Alphaproteobacteria bacterium]